MQPIVTSINETARALSLGRTSVYALIRERRLDAVKLGRRTLIKIASIQRLIEGNPEFEASSTDSIDRSVLAPGRKEGCQ